MGRVTGHVAFGVEPSSIGRVVSAALTSRSSWPRPTGTLHRERISDLGANVRVNREIGADIPAGAPEHVVRTVTENGRTLKFTSQGFEQE